jgi:hypothetical protein
MDPDQALEIADEACKRVGYDARALPPSLQVVHLIGRLNVEVILGGVLGWLINAGEYGPDTAKAFDAVGAHQCASIVREILAFFPGGTPAIEDRERVRQIEVVEDVAEVPWRELGNRLLAWPDDIQVLLQRFIDEHEADFS